MRKKEYVHIHALLVEVTRYVLENERPPAETMSDYEALETRPASIHEPKRKHHEAIKALGDGLEQWLEQPRDGERERSVHRPQ